MKQIIFLSLLFIFLACSSEKKSEVLHPTIENLNVNSDNSIIDITKTKPDISKVSKISILSTIEERQELFSIGELYGDEELMFGRIEDIEIDIFNRIYILDLNKQHIRVFNFNGEYVTTLGGRGQGPGEFERASSMAVYRDEYLIVSNGYRLEIFEISENEIKFNETLQFENAFLNICTLGDRLFAHRSISLESIDSSNTHSESPHTIQAFALPSFEPLFSFGKSYISSNPMVISRLSPGYISCNELSETVLFAFEKMQIVQGYSAKDGQLNWATRIDGLKLTNIIETDNGGRTRLTYRTPKKDFMDIILPPVSFRDQFELMQIIRRNVPNPDFESDTQVLTILINSTDGTGLLISNELPDIINKTDEYVFTVSDDYIRTSVNRLLFY